MVLRRGCSASIAHIINIHQQTALRDWGFEEFFGDEAGRKEEVGDAGGGGEVVF